MALGRRKPNQEVLWVSPKDLPKSPGHPFYVALNRLFADFNFDEFVEGLCEPFYADRGRPSIPPGVYFRMLFVGYFEDLDSQRGIAWRCADSLTIRSFLGFAIDKASPDHSSMTRTRQRLPLWVFEEVFCFVLGIGVDEGLVKGLTVGVDATLLEANAAMRNIVRRDSGDGWEDWLRKLILVEEGNENPTPEDLKRFDKGRRKRGEKKVSNKDWESKTDADSRIAKMKDGSTHLAYKAENVVDLDTDMLIGAEIVPADTGDTFSLMPSLEAAQGNLQDCDSELEIREIVADRGYHKSELLSDLEDYGLRSYIPERKDVNRRRWKDKPESWRRAFFNNRQRMRRAKGRRLQRRRSEFVERAFAHICETGGGRRMFIRGISEVNKRYKSLATARNLGLILRKLTGVGTPRSQTKKRGCGEGANSLLSASLAMWIGRLIHMVQLHVRRPGETQQRTLA